jgi:hypothetical protein
MLMISHSLIGFLDEPTSSKWEVDNLADRILDDYHKMRNRSSATNDTPRDPNFDEPATTTQFPLGMHC